MAVSLYTDFKTSLLNEATEKNNLLFHCSLLTKVVFCIQRIQLCTWLWSMKQGKYKGSHRPLAALDSPQLSRRQGEKYFHERSRIEFVTIQFDQTCGKAHYASQLCSFTPPPPKKKKKISPQSQALAKRGCHKAIRISILYTLRFRKRLWGIPLFF